MWQIDNNWIHFIGIGGITVGQTAAAFLAEGFKVTGSDLEIFEPMATYLKNHPQIKIYTDYKYTNLVRENNVIPGTVVVNGGLNTHNKELLFAKKRGIKLLHYPQVLQEKTILQGKSIVVAGSYGKTTTTAILVKILQQANKNPSYMVGGIVADLETGVKFKESSSQYSVIEGDEYISARWDLKSKFFYYDPHFLLITGYAYDHTDIFTTEQQYLDNFRELIKTVPADGLILLNSKIKVKDELKEVAKCKVHEYQYNPAEFTYTTKLRGYYNRENILAAATMAKLLGIDTESVETAIAKFQGISRRLQSVFTGEINSHNVEIIDDFGATPAKAYGALTAIREEKPQANIIAVFEPNIGSRTSQAMTQFSNVFDQADYLVLPQFTEVNQSGLVTNSELLQASGLNSSSGVALEDNSQMKTVITDKLVSGKENIILFLSSHAIDKFLKELQS